MKQGSTSYISRRLGMFARNGAIYKRSAVNKSGAREITLNSAIAQVRKEYNNPEWDAREIIARAVRLSRMTDQDLHYLA